MKEIREIREIFFKTDKVLFYDACSFQRHSNLHDPERNILIRYFKECGITVFITRCILMELSGDQHRLKSQYVGFIHDLNDAGVQIILFHEEDSCHLLSACFSTTEKINEYLIWAVRMSKSPTGTITSTLELNDRLYSEVVEGKNLGSSDLYQRFFSTVRNHKEHEDNLGEELLSICVHILSCLPGFPNGKLCVLTDDKGAAGKIDSVMRKTRPAYRGSKILLFSTPKLVQHMYQEGVELSEDSIVNILSSGTSGKLVVMGTTEYDLNINRFSLSCRDLAQKMMRPHGISIVF